MADPDMTQVTQLRAQIDELFVSMLDLQGSSYARVGRQVVGLSRWHTQWLRLRPVLEDALPAWEDPSDYVGEEEVSA